MAAEVDRRPYSAADILTPSRAAERLPVRAATAMDWLRDADLIRDVPGLGRVVVWGDVLGAIAAGDGPRTPPRTRPQPRAEGTLPRVPCGRPLR